MANDFILGESGIMRTGKTVPKIVRGANADVLDNLFANTKDIAKEVGNVGKTAIKTGRVNPVAEYAPYIGDIYDITRGGYQAFHGHPFVGTAQALMGVGGLAANALAPGSGTLAKAGIKAGGRALLKAGGKQLAKKAVDITAKRAKKPILNAVTRPIIPEIYYAWKGNNEQPIEQPIQEEALVGNNQQAKQPIANNQANQQYPYTAPFDSIENLILSKTGGYNNNIEGQDLPDIQSLNTGNTPVDAEGSIAGNIDLNGMLDRYRRQQELQKPYIEGLQNLINNYNNLQRNAFNLDRYFTGLAGWSGNDRWADFGKRYNPITTEATKLDLLNKLAQGQIGIDDIENEMRGNIALAQQAGIDPRVAMANPKLVNALASIENAKTSAAARRYVADQNKEGKLIGIYSNAMIQKAKQEGNWDLALRLQEMRNDGRLQSAIVNAVSFGADPSVIYSALQGYKNGGNVQNDSQQPPKEKITTPTGSAEANKASNLLDNIKR